MSYNFDCGGVSRGVGGNRDHKVNFGLANDSVRVVEKG